MKSHPIISHFKIQSFALVRFCLNLQKLIKFKHTELSAIINHDIIQQKCCECDYDEKKSHTNVLQISFVSFDQKLFFSFSLYFFFALYSLFQGLYAFLRVYNMYDDCRSNSNYIFRRALLATTTTTTSFTSTTLFRSFVS